jgi:dTDP-4-dehydrorhamnose reductase
MKSGLPSVLVLGGNGMFGHVLFRECERRFDTHATIRSEHPSEVATRALDVGRIVEGVHAEQMSSVERALDRIAPDVVVNCIGVVKQLNVSSAEMIGTNSLFPHQLEQACGARGVRLIHVSTDCVFSGRQGGYTEDDTPDPEDLYGRSKLLGEPNGRGVLTIRTSMIGRELESANGLLEWFLSQSGEVRGFTEAMFTGPTAPVLADAIADLIELHPDLEGIWHLGAEPISKYDLLILLRDAYQLDLQVEADDSVKVDRTLDSSRFRAATGWAAPPWPEMVAALVGAADGRPESRPVARR